LILKQIALTNFRNYAERGFELGREGNLIIAPNGCGKTNLLEAMAYCGVGKSIRFHRDEDILRDGAEFFSLRSVFEEDTSMELKLQISWQQGKKLLKINDAAERQLSRIFQCVKVIYSAPEDMNLISGYPRFRRQYFDLAVAQIYPEYIALLRSYLHVVEQRNALLKKTFDSREKHSWDLKFCDLLTEVLQYRRKYLDLLNKSLSGEYTNISGQVREIKVKYLYHILGEEPGGREHLARVLQELEQRETKYQRTLIGAHLDDYEFLLNGHNLRTYGSQGQKRITVIVTKLIQAALIEKLTGIKPILLFDDVFAELDLEHSHRIRQYVDYRYQVFIASPREDIAQEWGELDRLNIQGESA
jgi:DNA replication and repair protein RecF